MPKYETVFLTRPDLSANQNEKLITDFTDIIEKNKGKVKSTELAGLRSLAYRIKKNKKAHYILLNIEADHIAIQEMERNMRINEDILRYLTIKVDEFGESPSALSPYKSKEERRYDAAGTDEQNINHSGGLS